MKNYLFQIILALVIASCGTDATDSNDLTNTHSVVAKDPFEQTITESQFFTIDPTKDNVLEGTEGTLLVAPKGCFLDSKGNPVTDNIEIELKECLSMEEMLLSNLTTTSEGKPLETDGMVYIDATANGEPLSIDAENPLYVEIPTDKVKEGMLVYKGTRDEDGNMEWSDPKDLENFLVAVDLDLLDFLPAGFAEAVEGGMPFRKHKTATDELIDSLYYSLSVSNGDFLTQGFTKTDYNEAYNNPSSEVVNGQYTDASFQTNSSYYSDEMSVADSTSVNTEAAFCGIDPAKIKVLKSEEFQNTLIATREFEARLKALFSICEANLLGLYLEYLEKDLWEIDAMIADRLNEGSGDEAIFREFAAEKKTNVPGSKKYSEALKDYYTNQLEAIKQDLEDAKNKAVAELQEKNEVAQKVADEYKAILFKREAFRMEKYGFEWSSTGWLNIDNGTLPKDWGPQRFELTVTNGKSVERCYSYVVYTSLKSLYRMNTNDGELFFVGNSTERSMLMPKKKLAVAITIGYIEDVPYLGVQEFTTGDLSVTTTLEESSIEAIKETIKPYDDYNQENRIDVDLEYMTFFAKERKRQNKLRAERDFINELWQIAFPCCNDIEVSIEEIDPESYH